MSFVEDNPFKSSEQDSHNDLNKQIAKKLQNLAEGNFYPPQNTQDKGESAPVDISLMEHIMDIDRDEIELGFSRIFEDKNGKTKICLEAVYTDEYRDINEMNPAIPEPVIDLELLPDGFRYPFYSLSIYGNPIDEDSGIEVSSPYGTLLNYAVSEEGKIWRLFNSYVFNQRGQAAKFEVIQEDPIKFKLNVLDKMDLKHGSILVDYSLSEDDSRAVPLTEDDYISINKIITNMELGTYLLSMD